MPAKLLMTALSAAALALGSPAAHAHPATYDCVYASEAVGAVSQTREGTAVGYVVHPGDPDATIRCYLTVDGTEVSSTPAGTGVTAGPVSFTASEDSHVLLCAEVTTDHGTVTECEAGELDPWEVVRDVLDEIGGVCAMVGYFEGDYVLVTINSQGDVYVDGEPFWDCVPNETRPPGA